MIQQIHLNHNSILCRTLQQYAQQIIVQHYVSYFHKFSQDYPIQQLNESHSVPFRQRRHIEFQPTQAKILHTPEDIKLPQLQPQQQDKQQQPQQSLKKYQALPAIYPNPTYLKISQNCILIYNKVFQKQVGSLNQNKDPCKHLKCQTLAYLDASGNVICQSKCQWFHITEAMFDNSNYVFQRGECNGQFNQLRSTILMAKFVNDSLEMANMNDQQKEQFALQFQQVFVRLFQFNDNKA
ncbi:unnamed protein product [Paramecium octaurelia]|uniref:Uncharacterized protein n=1 Tax=Paramecium octaurelia TaxID=43137 RepID=A0A8S1V4J6_PAROT|nr:unnamed protein product [Paramecium octaurelia]